jgi:UDP-N-acetylmuramoyl-tripeptide--D-alanyl-D-alanine ligase
VARAAGADPARAVPALADVRLPAGRGTVQRLGDLTVIDDTYNANPSSVRRAVDLADWLARKHRRPLAVVVGSMLELGAESAKLHAALAAEIVARKPALVGAVGEFVRAFEPHRDVLGARLITAGDAETLGPKLRAGLSGNAVVLVKASRGVALERVLRHLK